MEVKTTIVTTQMGNMAVKKKTKIIVVQIGAEDRCITDETLHTHSQPTNHSTTMQNVSHTE